MAEGQRQRAGYQANFVIYPAQPGPSSPVPMCKSESALSLSVSQPLPPRLQQRRGTICTSELIRVDSNGALVPMRGRGPPPMAVQPMRPCCMAAPSFAEAPRTVADPSNYGRCPWYGRPYSPPPSPPPEERRLASGRRSPVHRLLRAYDEDDYDGRCGNRGYDDDYDDGSEYVEPSRRPVPSPRRPRSRKDAVGPATSTMRRSGSRLRILRIERDSDDSDSERWGAAFSTTVAPGRDRTKSASPTRLDDMAADSSCVCTCGPSRSWSRSPPYSPSRGRVSGIYIKSQHDQDAEELYLIKRIKDKKGNRKKRRKTPPPAPPTSPAQPSFMGLLCNMAGIENEAQPSPQPPLVPDSDTDENEYELMRLDSAELDKLCLQMGVKRNADTPGKK